MNPLLGLENRNIDILPWLMARSFLKILTQILKNNINAHRKISIYNQSLRRDVIFQTNNSVRKCTILFTLHESITFSFSEQFKHEKFDLQVHWNIRYV